MTYMELMNRFWLVNLEANFTGTEAKLYFALLDIANSLHWEKETLSLPTNILISKVDCSKKTLINARKKLETYGLIHVTKGEKNIRAAVYRILDAPRTETRKYTTETKIEPKRETLHSTKGVIKEEPKPGTKTAPERVEIPTPYIRKDKEEEKENKRQDNKKPAHSSSSSKEIMESYNAICPSLIQASRLTLPRRVAIQKLWKHFNTLDDWKEYFIKVADISFLCGGSSGWKANFDWVLEEENYLKVMEGRFYGGTCTKGSSIVPDDNALAEIYEAEYRRESVPF